MPRPAKGARLWLDPATRKYVILDTGNVFRRTGCGEADREGAEAQLEKYIAGKYKPAAREGDPHKVSIAEALTAYGREVAPGKGSCETIGYEIGNLVEWWGTRTLAEVNKMNCEAYAEHARRRPVYATNGRLLRVGIGNWRIRGELGTLSAAIGHWHKDHGPLTAVPAVTLPPKPSGKSRWLTRSEAALLLAGALGFYRSYACDICTRKVSMRWKRYHLGINRHAARFILLGLRTGTRKGALLEVQWMPNTSGGWVDLDRGVMHRRGRGVAETTKRRPPVRLGKGILAHLRRWKRLDDAERARLAQEAAIDGEEINLAVFLHVVSWRGQRVASVRRSWEMAVDLAWLHPENTGDDGVTPHVLRHTRATWMMQQGVDKWEASGALGMSLKILEDVYGHHHPDWQKEAAEV